MSLSPAVKVLIIMNNYFHDVATAMLLASAIILWLVGRAAEKQGPEAVRWFAGLYPTLTKVALFSIAWIVVGGIPRTIFFTQVEWNLADPSNKYLFAALMVKHGLMWLCVIVGGAMWIRMRSLARRVLARPGATSTSATQAGSPAA